METIISSCISAGAAIVVCVMANKHQAEAARQAAKQRHDETKNLIVYQINELTKRVDKHNNVIERTYKLETKAAVVEKEIENIKGVLASD